MRLNKKIKCRRWCQPLYITKITWYLLKLQQQPISLSLVKVNVKTWSIIAEIIFCKDEHKFLDKVFISAKHTLCHAYQSISMFPFLDNCYFFAVSLFLFIFTAACIPLERKRMKKFLDKSRTRIELILALVSYNFLVLLDRYLW